MKILFDHASPFFLSHGGFQVQIEQTKHALESIGLQVDWVRWWDENQKGDLIHYFGRPPHVYIELAHQKGFRVVMGELLGGLGVRGPTARTLQRGIMTLARKLAPGGFLTRLAWDAYRLSDACIALTPWEAQLMSEMFGAPPGRVHVVPNGVEPVFLESREAPRGPWLLSTGTITEVKRVVEVAEAAIQAQTPIWFIGRAYDESLPYPRRFFELARANPRFVRYEGPIHDRTALAESYRQARGFVLLSRWETLSVAALEAAACRCPLLLSDLAWAHSTFGPHAQYVPLGSTASTAGALRRFYDHAPQLPPPPLPLGWRGVGERLRDIYQQALASSPAARAPLL